MFTLILLGIVTVIGTIGAIVVENSRRHYDLECLSGMFLGNAICAFIALCISAGLLININTRFEAIQNEHEVICEMINSYDGQDYGNMSALTASVVKMNAKIAQHKAHYKSKWTGLWYSEDIANLEPITFSKKVIE